MISRYVADVFSKWLWNGPSRAYYYWNHLCFCIPHALYFYCKVFIFLEFIIIIIIIIIIINAIIIIIIIISYAHYSYVHALKCLNLHTLYKGGHKIHAMLLINLLAPEFYI